MESSQENKIEFVSRLSSEADIPAIATELTNGQSGEFNLGFLFTAHHTPETISQIVERLKSRLNVDFFLSCTCGGIIGSQDEIENKPAASLILAKLPNVKITPFSMQQSQLEQLESAENWYDFFEVYPNEKPIFLTLADPFLFDMNKFLKGINEYFKEQAIVGGLASGAIKPNQNTLILNNEKHDEGLIGVVLTGDIAVDTVVSQGCRPIGETFIITKAEENIVYEIAGQPFVKVLKDVLDQASAKEKLLAQEALFIGIAMDEYQHKFKRGDFLIRTLLGIDSKSGAAAIGDLIKQGQTIQFHVRDAEAATEELIELLRLQQEQKNHEKPSGALIFSCNGRGERLFREKNHDIKVIQQHLGPFPAAGFFCAGEIGPVGQSNYLHGFTSSMALFYPKK